MSKNVKTYILIGLVLIIWGVIGIKVFRTLSPEPQAPVFAENINFKPKKVVQRDTFSIVADYRDPFLGTMPTSNKKRTKKVKQPVVQFPSINYTGLISGQQNKDHIYFVTIDGTQYLMQKRNENKGVSLISGTSEGIRVRYKGIVKTIPLQNAEN
ncbi:hypothetical protein [Flagellimonas eckloniae]|uniref:Type II secretion system protein GspC N-terminal domain-containing protein n=1 Tax=Flagellimonas eckloniae TaxID=346185 RepID=A0A0Q1BGC6_9FLAO|nr:hypothetical protein [Allomuricauda eckloniae]KQC29380.1 hypothetical protein AAY42_05285 [Allomuricauda eckloniae]